ncbi:transcriptional activator RfaH [compost metagenome]
MQPELVSGEPVRINEGPFAELQAIYLGMDGDERVIVLLNFLQRQQQLSLPVSGVSKL